MVLFKGGDVYSDVNGIICLVILGVKEVCYKEKDALIRFKTYSVKLGSYLAPVDMNFDELLKFIEEKGLTKVRQESDLLSENIASFWTENLIKAGASFRILDGSFYQILDTVDIFYRDGIFGIGEIKKGYLVLKTTGEEQTKFALTEDDLINILAFNSVDSDTNETVEGVDE